MARIVFAAPGVDRFHLHDRLGRELLRRGHDVETVLADRAAATFWRAQGQPATLLEPAAADRIADALARLLPAALRRLDAAAPDLIVLHGPRTAERRLLHFAGRALGRRILWLGDGLLPHTLQCDGRGLDAEASAAGRDPFVYRRVAAEPELLDACLAHLMANPAPFALPRRAVLPPPLPRRLRDALAALRRDGVARARRALGLWRSALPGPPSARVAFLLPKVPFVAALLQHPADERRRLDAVTPPSAAGLVEATAAAAAALAPGLCTVAVLPAGGLPDDALADVRAVPGVQLVPAAAAAQAAATAVAVTTVNHPGGLAALLAGTPVLHTGRALYGLRTVTRHVPVDGFAAALHAAAEADEVATLRARFLTWLVGRCHVWCSPTHPDHNGMLGLAEEVEHRLGTKRPPEFGFRYRRGPAWPLSVPPPRRPTATDER